jgi:hypothetical protein
MLSRRMQIERSNHVPRGVGQNGAPGILLGDAAAFIDPELDGAMQPLFGDPDTQHLDRIGIPPGCIRNYQILHHSLPLP